MEKTFELLDAEVLEKFDVEILYVKVFCVQCQNSWGVSVRDGVISKRSLVCEKCAGNRLAEEN